MRNTLRDIRLKNQMTFQQVADGAGITKEYYWQIENGKRGLSYELAVKIASVFSKRPDEIFLQDELTKTE